MIPLFVLTGTLEISTMKKYAPLVIYLAFLVGLAVATGFAVATKDAGIAAILAIVAVIAILFGRDIVDQAASGRFE